MGKPEANFPQLASFSHYVDPGESNLVSGVASKRLYPLSHLARLPVLYFKRKALD